MSVSEQADSDKALAQAIVNDFHEYFSTLPPFTQGSRYVLPHALITVPLPPAMGGLSVETFADMYARVSQLLLGQYDSGIKSFAHRLAEPDAEVWVSGNIAAVLVGWSASVNDRDIVHSLNLCTLHRIANQTSDNRNPWRISGLVDMKHLSPEIPMPPVETGPVSEIIAPFEALLGYIKLGDWEAIPSLLLPRGGATISHGTQDPVTFLWPEFIKRLQVEAETGPVTERKLSNCEVRQCVDLAFVWAPFMLLVDGRDYTQGISVCSFRMEDGQWLITGLQETYFNN
ncbi:hypothetical protein BP6252_06693 [Coleophoma cylindrospora]|uniref:SnoaL-like domain-containing protein n=1 Tax=Coleophoma cylindrospora TaxID=1849047 RepID=A0A3D8RP16_9HELO|nr:hypothetical protein BP6252_06693 [Coleophoma cylindrospora]